MDSTIVVALIVTIGGWVYYIIQKLVDKRYNRAKETVEGNSATIVDMTNVIKGFKELVTQYRARIKELEDEVEELKGGSKNV